MAAIRKFGTAGTATAGVGLPLMVQDGALKVVDGGGVNTVLVTATTGSVTTEVHLRARTSDTVGTVLKASGAAVQTAAAADLVCNPGGNDTTATKGFLFIPTCAGTPTGVPANTYTNCLALTYDRTAHKLYVYDSGWKATAALS
jgi:hypothetical protein